MGVNIYKASMGKDDYPLDDRICKKTPTEAPHHLGKLTNRPQTIAA